MKAGSEAAFQQQVLPLAAFYGWRSAHFHDSRREVVRRGQRVLIGDRAAAGFPDLVLVRGPELIFAELKGEKTRVTEDQKAWIAALQVVESAANHPENVTHTVDVFIWRPRDFDEINERLARGRHKTEPTYRSAA